MKIKTVAYKGSKRKLLNDVLELAQEINAQTAFDGFSGTGIVSAYLRSNGIEVQANDLNVSSYLYGSVFLRGYKQNIVDEQLKIINNLHGLDGWITNNYSGSKERVIRGTNGKTQERPLGYQKKNASKIDAAREYVKNADLGENERNALIFAIILAADKVFNNSNDQKSCLKEWTAASKKDILFIPPTNIEGPIGKQYNGNILDIQIKSDFIYFDPPYTTGVLYEACYHLNDSIAKWDKPELDYSYAIPRPRSKTFKNKGKVAGGFYSKKTATDSFMSLFSNCNSKRIVLSYSDAPRNVLSCEQLVIIAKNFGNVEVRERNHRLCSQSSKMRKVSTSLKEYFIVIDTW